MTTQVENANSEQDRLLGSCLLWFIWGVTASFLAIFSLVLLGLIVASISLNAYLAWELSGYEVLVSRSISEPAVAAVAEPDASPEAVVNMLPDLEPAEVAMLLPPERPLKPPGPIPARTPVATETPTPDPTVYPLTNEYTLIPLEATRDASLHGDISLKLRDPEPNAGVELNLQHVDSHISANPPQFKEIFQEPEFLETYTVHHWDGPTYRKMGLLEGVQAVTIKTTPGQPIYIPKRGPDIYKDDQDTFHALLLYASEDSLTFIYARQPTVEDVYTVHYVGLQTDPNLLELYQKSGERELPGLTLDTPVGLATDRLMIAIRDKGKYMDVRSKKDWWQ
jgi:hypothetical protein